MYSVATISAGMITAVKSNAARGQDGSGCEQRPELSLIAIASNRIDSL